VVFDEDVIVDEVLASVVLAVVLVEVEAAASVGVVGVVGVVEAP
jgi:hypothetical protein